MLQSPALLDLRLTLLRNCYGAPTEQIRNSQGIGRCSSVFVANHIRLCVKAVSKKSREKHKRKSKYASWKKAGICRKTAGSSQQKKRVDATSTRFPPAGDSFRPSYRTRIPRPTFIKMLCRGKLILSNPVFMILLNP